MEIISVWWFILTHSRGFTPVKLSGRILMAVWDAKKGKTVSLFAVLMVSNYCATWSSTGRERTVNDDGKCDEILYDEAGTAIHVETIQNYFRWSTFLLSNFTAESVHALCTEWKHWKALWTLHSKYKGNTDRTKRGKFLVHYKCIYSATA